MLYFQLTVVRSYLGFSQSENISTLKFLSSMASFNADLDRALAGNPTGDKTSKLIEAYFESKYPDRDDVTRINAIRRLHDRIIGN